MKKSGRDLFNVTSKYFLEGLRKPKKTLSQCCLGRDRYSDWGPHDRYQALGGVGIVLSVEGSEVISMVSLPDFNSNLQSKEKDIQKFNRASLGVYEMGSVIKFFTIAAELNAML